MIKWTFGIITNGKEWSRVDQICRSIRSDSSNYYNDQIIIVGGLTIPGYIGDAAGITHIPFDETQKKGWITRKKNIVAKVALHENICLLHDYVKLEEGWHQGFEDYGDDWLTCITPVHNKDGSRFRDWCVIYNDAWMDPPIDDQVPPSNSPPGQLLSYKNNNCGRYLYYSGAYFCAKKEALEKIPLDESRLWGGGEDVKWSRLIYKEYGSGVFQINEYSSVRFLKQKQPAPWENLRELSKDYVF